MTTRRPIRRPLLMAATSLLAAVTLAAWTVPPSSASTMSRARPDMPDLVVTSGSIKPTSASPGAPVVFSATVRNGGKGATPAGTIIGVRFDIDGVAVSWSDTRTTSLAAGASFVATATGGLSGSAWAATTGSHTLVAWADDVNRIAESKETNNQTTTMLTVAGSSPPTTTTTTTTPPTTTTSTTTTTTLPAPTTTTAPSGPVSGTVKLRQVDGGAPTNTSFFPIGVWFESVMSSSDTSTDSAAGLNTYVVLTNNSNLSLVRAAGMRAEVEWGQFPNAQSSSAPGSETVAWFLGDEYDMIYGPGWNPCGQSSSGYTCMQNAHDEANDGRPRATNYGKGVTFWETNSQAATFVNNFQDIVSADNYWYTDADICQASQGGKFYGGAALTADQCRRASNYGKTIDRLRLLESPAGHAPVYGFVEVGQPFGNGVGGNGPSPEQIQAAVWSSIVHGARGIIYFNHSFGGTCQSQHDLRTSCYAAQRAAVTTTNNQIAALAPVLNSPFADGYVSAPGADVMAKWSNNKYYVFAGNTDNASKTVTYSLTCTGNATATVVNENRTIPVVNGQFTDALSSGTANHIYRIDGGTTCVPG
jgi:hypothetical protein